MELSAHSADVNVEILQLKINLKGSKPPIWRRIQIPSSYTFQELHRATNQAMGWYDMHMHDFHHNNKIKGTKLRIIQSRNDDDSFMPPNSCNVSENKILVVNVLKNEKDYVDYMYDFGDGWIHKIILEKKLLAKQSELKNFPKCLTGRRACPPEDCGGIQKYNTLVTLLGSKDRSSHPDYQNYKDYLEDMDSDFDPAAFDPSKIYLNGLKPDLMGCCLS